MNMIINHRRTKVTGFVCLWPEQLITVVTSWQVDELKR